MNKLSLFQKGKVGNMHFGGRKNNYPDIFFFTYLLIIVVVFVFLALRFFELTVVKGQYYRTLSEQNRIRELLIEPRRGTLLDRLGFTLVKNLPADTSKNDPRLPSQRIYQSPEALAPFVGYEQIADQNNFNNDNCINKLTLGDKIGKKGIEQVFDCDLRGRPGKKLVEIDAKGKFLNTLSIIPPSDGTTLQLALDMDIQQKAYDLLQGKKGAIIALKPQTGEVLGFVSTPSFSPQAFFDANNNAINSYLKSDDKPLFNRATEGVYSPGSIFKLVLATGALEDKKIDENKEFEDTGILHAGPITFGNWYFLEYGRTDGMVNVIKGLQRSNDIFFYQVGNLLGPERIQHWANVLGFGKKTGIGFDEADGLLPSPFWKQETIHDQWYTGDTYNLSIGQGYLLVTPLQVAQATSVFANNGTLCKPKLLKIGANDNLTNPIFGETECKKLPISQKTLDLVRTGMKEACAPGGTGWPLFNFGVNKNGGNTPVSTTSAQFQPIPVACKTGTAQTPDETTLPDAWITVYAPADNPQIVLTILIEKGGQGSDVAGPIARDILKAYFGRSE